MKGEERFGFVTSFLYLLFSKTKAKEFYGFVIKDILASKGRNILDVGTGPGKVAIEVAKGGKEVYAVDPSRDMVKIAKKDAKSLRNIHISLGSSREIPFRKRFDFIFSSLSLHHWTEKEESLIYLSRFLTKNGEIRIYEYNKDKVKGFRWFSRGHSLSKKELYDIGKGASLKVRGVLKRGEFIRTTYIIRS